jgi:hypothetical protein
VNALKVRTRMDAVMVPAAFEKEKT